MCEAPANFWMVVLGIAIIAIWVSIADASRVGVSRRKRKGDQ